MSFQILKRNSSLGKTRSEQEENLRKEWGTTMTDVQLDKLKHIEKKIKRKTGSESNFVERPYIDQYK